MDEETGKILQRDFEEQKSRDRIERQEGVHLHTVPPPLPVSSVSSVNPVIQCTDDVSLIHPHCLPAMSWHNQFMPPMFSYFLYILSRRKKQKQATSAINSREGPVKRPSLQQKRESTGILLGVASADRILLSENSFTDSKTSSATRLWPPTDDVVVASLAFFMLVIVSVHVSGDRTARSPSLTSDADQPLIPNQKSPWLIPRGHRRSVAPGLPVEKAALLEELLQRTFPGRSSNECCHRLEIKTIEYPGSVEDSDQYGLTSEDESDCSPAQAIGHRAWGEPSMLPGNSECHGITVERECCDLQQLDLWADSLKDATGDAPNLSLNQTFVRKAREELSSGSCRDHFLEAQARRNKFLSRRYEGEIAVRQSVVNRIRQWIPSSTMWGECHPLIDAFPSKHLQHFPNLWTQQQNAPFQPWNDAYLWMHPPNDLREQCVSKLPFDGARGVAIQPVPKDADWW